MKRSHFKRISSKKDVRTTALGASLVIVIILLVAAYCKLFYPAYSLKTLERGISVIEILFAGVVFFFRKHWKMWLVAAGLFAAWFGYTLFWYTLKLPCNCMGTLFTIPTAFMVILDFLLFSTCMIMGLLLGAERKYLQLSLLVDFLLAFVGFAFANWMYYWSV